VSVPATVHTSAKALVAQGMHLGVAEITSQLQRDPHTDLMTIAKAQGLAQDQLQRILLSALQSASAQAVSADSWTQQQADSDMAYWSQQRAVDLIADITAWFRSN